MHRSNWFFLLVIVGPLLSPSALHAQQDPGTEVTLPEALERFHRHSPRMEMARARLRGTLGGARQGRAVPNPSISGSHEELGVYSESYLLVNQRLAFLWERGSRNERAQARVREARARFTADSVRLVASLKTAFVEAWSAANAVTALRTADRVLDRLVVDAEVRVREGDLAGYDLRRLRWERARLSRRLALAEVSLEAAERDLGALVSEGATAARVSATGLEPDGPPETGPDAMLQEALARRSELTAVDASIRALEEETGLASRSWLAGTNATGGLKTQSDGSEGWFVGLEVPLPLTDRREAARMEARAAVEEARAGRDALARAVALEVTRAEARLRSLRMQSRLVAPLGDDGAVELLEIARVSYAEGEIGILELLDAAAAFLDARLTRDRIRGEAWGAYFDLEAAVGGFGPAADTEGRDR